LISKEYCGNNLTRQAVTENLNVLDYETYFKVTDQILASDIPAKGFDSHHFIAGLASHFRDLLVCQTPQTINLLEVSQQIKQQYHEQAQKASAPFLVQGIELANTCDLQYKTSKNQRLLVELCLMKLASILTPDEKKKAQLA